MFRKAAHQNVQWLKWEKKPCWLTQPEFTVPRPKIYEARSEKQGKRQHLAASLTNLLSRSLFHSANSEALGTEHTHILWMYFKLVSLTFVLSCWSKITCNFLYRKGIINYPSHTLIEKQDSPAHISSARKQQHSSKQNGLSRRAWF